MGKGDLVLVGGRPGMGKTSFAMNIAVNFAKATGEKVGRVLTRDVGRADSKPHAFPPKRSWTEARCAAER